MHNLLAFGPKSPPKITVHNLKPKIVMEIQKFMVLNREIFETFSGRL
jgi:hypothetical protein